MFWLYLKKPKLFRWGGAQEWGKIALLVNN
jgi:hypothetical protein